MKHHYFRLHVINKGNNIKNIHIIHINAEDEEHAILNSSKMLHEGGCSYRQIATRCGCRHTTDSIIIKRLQQSGNLKDKPRIGRPKCSTACVEPTGRKQPQNWSDSGRSSHGSSVQPSVRWRTPSVDTSTLGKDAMVRWVQVPAISNPSKCQNPKETWGRICTCLHWGWGTLFSYEWGRRRESAGWGVF